MATPCATSRPAAAHSNAAAPSRRPQPAIDSGSAQANAGAELARRAAGSLGQITDGARQTMESVDAIACAIWRAAAAKRREFLKKEAQDTLTVHYQKEVDREP